MRITCHVCDEEYISTSDGYCSVCGAKDRSEDSKMEKLFQQESTPKIGQDDFLRLIHDLPSSSLDRIHRRLFFLINR